MSLATSAKRIFKHYFVGGLLVVVPLIVTYLVLELLFTSVDGILGKWIHKIFGFYWPGLGVAATLLLVILAGILTRNYLGTRFIRYWEQILTRIPLIRPVYSGAKGLMQATTADSTASFKDVVMIQYPREGYWSVGFIASNIDMTLTDRPEKYVAVYLPNTPTPFTGWTVLVAEKEVVPIDMTVEQAIKYVVSGGVVSPTAIVRRSAVPSTKGQEVPREAR